MKMCGKLVQFYDSSVYDIDRASCV